MDIDCESLRDVAIKLANEQVKNENNKGPNERSIFILGSKGCGKTTLLNHLLERNEATRPTLSLDYSFTRKTSHAGQSTRRQVCHLWELGGTVKKSSEMLASVPLAATSNGNLLPTTIIVMLDLSRPKNLWTDVDEAISCLNSAIAIQAAKRMRDIHSFSTKPEIDRIPEGHPDIGTVDPFPVSLVLLGGKYDIFRDHEPEIKKRICKSLRSCGHRLAATVCFYSNTDPALVKRAKEILDGAAFGRTGLFKGLCTDYNKPIFIPAGADTWADIGTEPLTLPAISMSYFQWFPSESVIALPIDDPASDPAFREDLLDAARALKDEELKQRINIKTHWTNDY